MSYVPNAIARCAGAARRAAPGIAAIAAAIAAALVLASCASTGPAKAPAASLTDEERRLNVESFEYVWKTVRDKYWDPSIGGLDWSAVHAEFLPRIEAAATKEEARRVLNEMVDRLGVSHFGVIPKEVYEKTGIDSAGSAGDGWSGIDLRIIDGAAIITEVADGSPASLAGLKPGWEIARIGETGVRKLIDDIVKGFPGERDINTSLVAAIRARLRGESGERIALVLRDGRDRRVTRAITLGEPRGRLYRLGYLPPFHVWLEKRTIGGDIGYIRFNCFLDPVSIMPAFEEAMSSYGASRGIVVDLRGNPGGLGDMARGMAGFFVAERGRSLGIVTTRGSELKLVLNPRPRPFTGPLAILVDGMSASSSEFFAGGLQDLGRARVFGERTPGQALAAAIERLPNGDAFMFVFANFATGSGRVIEGAGVEPDEPIAPTRSDYLAGRDPVIDAAVSWIREKR